MAGKKNTRPAHPHTHPSPPHPPPPTLHTPQRISVLSGSALAGATAAAFAVPPAASTTDAHFAAATAAAALVRALTDGETAHRLAVWAAAKGLTPVDGRPDPPSLRTTVWGRRFRNPLGLAAGFDKDADAIDGMLGLGFGFVEIGRMGVCGGKMKARRD